MNRLLSLAVLLVIITSCSPYADSQPATPTAQPTGTTAPQIATHTPTTTPARACIVSTGVQAGNLNIRTGAGTSYAVIGILREGQAATLTDQAARGNWIQIKAGNLTGWINQRYCKGDK